MKIALIKTNEHFKRYTLLLLTCPYSKLYSILFPEYSKLYVSAIFRHADKMSWFQDTKSNLHYTCGITSTTKQVTSGGDHLRGLALRQHNFEKTLQRWRLVGYTVSDLAAPGI